MRQVRISYSDNTEETIQDINKEISEAIYKKLRSDKNIKVSKVEMI